MHMRTEVSGGSRLFLSFARNAERAIPTSAFCVGAGHLSRRLAIHELAGEPPTSQESPLRLHLHRGDLYSIVMPAQASLINTA